MALYESEFSQVCTGTMYTELQHDNPVEKNPHNHLPDKEEIKVTKCIQKMKDQVTSSSMINPVEIFTENVSQIETATKARMPTEDTIIALAVLPPTEIPGLFDELKSTIPEDASEIMQWFENNCVHGRIRRITRGGNVSRTAPLFPSKCWSVFE
ncbi:hypothetical protein ACI65C_002210 [Semiaphis heraclei]